ncbi:MAG TPA: DUF1329 domain-containing protein [Candidatus Binataceae bacterium]|nr:DUF1329 domain-containing protein [Candidatus Binataceae bacterium]
MMVLRRSLCAILILLLAAGIVEAADNSQSIPVGTVITLKNWQQYQQFMPEGMRLLFAGTIFWKLPPDFQMVIGPTSSYPPPEAYLQNTEKYSNRVKIQNLPGGGHTITGYVAGLPFPNPADPMKGYKILVDNWYRYFPYLICGNDNHQVLQDRYGNTTAFKMAFVDRRLSHISDAGQPINDPRAQGIDYSEWEMVLEPEQDKYTTTLTLYYVDPARPEDDFLFAPTLRRVIRESSNSRCAPAFGSDWTPDDFKGGFNGGIAIFDANYLRDQALLTLVNADPKSFGTLSNYYPILFPKPEVGKWEVHNTYVIDTRRIPSMRAGYCYGKQIMYLDKDNFVIVWKDVYDSQMKFAKIEMVEHIATSVPNEGIQWETNNTIETVWDPDRRHMSWWATTGPGGRGILAKERCRNVDGEDYDDLQRYSSVSGLTQVMR